MRKNSRLKTLELQVQQLSEVVQELLEINTKPAAVPHLMVQENQIDWRKLPRKRVPAANAGNLWSKGELKLLASLVERNATRKEIGKIMGRSERAVGVAITRHLKGGN